MTKEEYYEWVNSQDTYPEHHHKFIVALYTGERGQILHRYVGPFEDRVDAKVFIQHYKEEYTKPGFITKSSIIPLCEVLWKPTQLTTPKN
jgi:hypothetical protein